MIELENKKTGAVLLRTKGNGTPGSDLEGADLRTADLRGAALARANLAHTLLSDADLRGADLTGADLSRAYCRGADLRGASLRGASLAGASLDSANGARASFLGADLTAAFLAVTRLAGADLAFASLHGAHLAGSDLSRARVGFTVFTDCRGLHETKGLAEVEHVGPSSLDALTLRRSGPGLPEVFLRGAGLSSREITACRLAATRGPAATCRVRFADSDRTFAERLLADLRAADVACWPARGDLGAGYFLQLVANRAAEQEGGLVLVASRRAVQDAELARDAAAAIDRERETGRQVLFPLALDDVFGSAAVLDIGPARVASGEWPRDWMAHAKQHGSIDFRRWRDRATYAASLGALTRALRRRPPRRLDPSRIPRFPR